MTVTIYHNPRCGKSRQTLQLLQARGIQPSVVKSLRTPPDQAALKEILDQLGLEPRELLRKGEAVYKQLGLGDPALSDDALIQVMADNPILIERPIVRANGKAALGRPPEEVLKIL